MFCVACSAWRRAEALAYECPPAPAVGRHLPLYFVRKGLRPAFGVRRRFLERRLRVLRSPHRTPSLVGALQPQRRRMKTRVSRIHSARRRADALAYECPPAPAVGRHLPLYFVRKGLRPAFGVRRRFLERRPRVLRSPHRTPSPGGALQPAETSGEDALRYPNARQKKTRQREGSAGSGLRGGRDPRNERCVASGVARVRR